MAKHISLSQFKSKQRQNQQKLKRAITNYNSAIKKYNNSVNTYNRNIKKAVADYNSFVRKFNSTVAHNRQIIKREKAKLSLSTTRTNYSASIRTMQNHYENVCMIYAEGASVTPSQNNILDLIEQENANNFITANAVLNNEFPKDDTSNIEIGNKLLLVSEDLNNRWKGAVFSLSPENPDAARHFCTSAREIFTEFIELKAPDDLVFSFNPNCAKTERGNATRKEKIKYMMRNLEMDNSVIAFADEDITNILELFHVLSDGTHGAAGRYEFDKLLQVRKRVEQGINFLCEISQ